jgi:WW domain-containing oxidoreductase
MSLKDITAVAMNPGGMPQSRCFADAPLLMKTIMSGLSATMPITKHLTSKLNTLEDASKNVVWLSMESEHEGTRGYFDGLKPSTSSSESRDEGKQAELWASCAKWAKLESSETVL